MQLSQLIASGLLIATFGILSSRDASDEIPSEIVATATTPCLPSASRLALLRHRAALARPRGGGHVPVAALKLHVAVVAEPAGLGAAAPAWLGAVAAPRALQRQRRARLRVVLQRRVQCLQLLVADRKLAPIG